MPQPHVFDAVLAAARRIPGYPRLRVLDLSAGRGEIAAALAGDGCTVRGTHFRADDYKLTAQSGELRAVPLLRSESLHQRHRADGLMNEAA